MPFSFQTPLPVEDLHTVVLTVRDIDPSIGIATDVVRNIELPWPDARATPGLQQFPFGRELVHAGIAVTVRHVDVPRR
jgi:hypothetical protein